MGVTAVRCHVVFVHQARVECDDQRAAVLNIKFKPVGFTPRQQMERRREHNFILRQILRRTREINGNISVVEGAIEEQDVVAQIKKLVWLVGLLQCPLVIVAVENTGFSSYARALQRGRQKLHLITKLRHLAKNPGVSARMVRQDCAMEFLGPKARLSPAEKEDSGGSTRNELIGKHAQNARTYQRIDLLPCNVAGLLFNHPKPRIPVRSANT